MPFPSLRFMLSLANVTMVCLLAGVKPAFGAEYRSVQLSDGRVFTAEIVDTTGDGMRLRMVQGEVDVSYGDLVSVLPVDEPAVQDAPVWQVELLGVECVGAPCSNTVFVEGEA